jgi:hypothetical protein
MIFHRLMAEGSMTIDQIGRLTIPQLICRFAEKPPDASERVTSYAAYEAALKRQEEDWNASP